MEQETKITKFGNIKLDYFLISDEESQQIENERKEKEKREYEERKFEHFKKSGIGEKYWKYRISDFDAYNDELKTALNTVEEFISDVKKGITRNLWLCGKNGNGKTMLASFIDYELFGTYKESSVIEDEWVMADNFRNEENRTDVRNRYKNYNVLIIDEVARFPSDREKEFLFKILNDRYNSEKSNVIITNMSRQETKQYFGQALAERFLENNCVSIEFTSPSYRDKKRTLA